MKFGEFGWREKCFGYTFNLEVWPDALEINSNFLVARESKDRESVRMGNAEVNRVWHGIGRQKRLAE
jgi:hypothetical protein